MTKLITGVAAVLVALSTAGTAGADPTPEPSPGYVIQGPGGPTVGGLPSLPPICGVQPRGMCRELVTRHWKLGFPAGNLNARKHDPQ